MAVRFVCCRAPRFGALVAGVAAAAGLFAALSTAADARGRHGYGRAHAVRHAVALQRYAIARHAVTRHGRPAGAAVRAGGGYLAPTYSAIVVDANTGRTLSASNENAPHHPASVTKVMTLYLLFEQLEQGKLKLDSDLEVSAHAAAQSPTKLGLRPGATIEVEDAIKALVTKSANDIAVAIAENIGGDEDSFAELMTRRARSLGMNGTTFKNASGLPNPGQITTARDLSILGRAIQDRFPRYYRYFATRTFYYAGRAIANHNHLLDRVEGMDGIKTGYTAASGFNLLTSVKRDGHYIVGVVLGGRSGAQRDTMMAGLIAKNIDESATRRTAVAIIERDVEMVRQSARVLESSPDADVETETPRKSPQVNVALVEAPAPASRSVTKLAAPLDLSVPPVPPGKLANRVDERPRPAFVTATARSDADDAEPTVGRTMRNSANDGSTGRAMAYAPTPAATTPSSLKWVEGPRGRSDKRTAEGRPESGKTVSEKTSVEKSVADRSSREKTGGEKIALVRPTGSGWMIQIGATDDADEAQDLLARAKAKAGLAAAKPFTEKVQKGRETLWRARFAGLEEGSAEAACKTLKRSGFSCFATKN